MLVFGGYNGSAFGDLHRYEVQINAWSALSPSGNAPDARFQHTAVFDSVSRAMFIFGGWDGSSNLNDLHRYDVQANAWSTLSPSGREPVVQSGHSAVFDAMTRTMVTFGGWDGSFYRNDLQSYDVQANAWSLLLPTSIAPVVRRYHTAVLDTSSQTMLVFGGYGNSGLLNDLHGYDVQANAWSALSPSGSAPSPRSGHTALWDSTSRVMLVFGGFDGSGVLNDLHCYDVQANAWRALSPSGTLPSVRDDHTAALDSASRAMLIFGGGDSSRHFNGLHALVTSAILTAPTTTTLQVQSVPVKTGADGADGTNGVPEELPEVVLGPAAALCASAAVAVVNGIFVGLWGRRVHRRAFGIASIQGFLMMEFCDCLSDVVALILARTEGGLQFSNDRGMVFIVLATSVGFSVLLFSIEVRFWARYGTHFTQEHMKNVHVMLACLHLTVEDSFQAVVYAFATASQVHSGLGLKASTVVAVSQAAVFTMAKVLEVCGAFDFCSFHGEGAAGPPAVETPAGPPAAEPPPTELGSRSRWGQVVSEAAGAAGAGE